MIYYIDTSAILNGALSLYPHYYIYLSPIVLMELENLKTNGNEHIRALAQKAIKKIADSEIVVTALSQRKIKHIFNKNNFLMDINDHKILCEAVILEENNSVEFITSDYAQLLFARRLKLKTIYFSPEEKQLTTEYYGWRDFTPTEDQLISIYSQPTKNILQAEINEYCKIFENDELKDVLRWDGEKYVNLKYKNIKNPYTGELIKPKNLEQRMALDLLQNQDIKVKLLTSAWGGGKTLLSLNYALDQISKGLYDKLVFIRNNIIAAGTNDIGYLPGTVRDKLAIFSRCIADHVGGEIELDRLIDENIVETVPLSHIRGRSLKNSIVLVDECENMDDKLVTLVMSRIEENSELIFCGDIAQIDKDLFKKHNGIQSMLKNLKGEKLFGTVKLIKSERGPVPRLCDKMIPPK